MTQSVNGRAEMQAVFFSVRRSQAAVESGSSNFESCLDKAGSEKSRVSDTDCKKLNTVKERPESLQKEQKPEEAQETGETSAQKQLSEENGKVAADGKTKEMKKADAADAAEAEAAVDGEAEAVGAEEIMATLAAAVMEFLTGLSEDVLSVTTEDVQEWMTAKDLSPADMLDPKNLQQMVMDMNGITDVSGFLTNGAALEEWQEVQSMLTDFLQEHEMLLTETAGAEQLTEPAEQVLQLQGTEQEPEKPVPEQKTDVDAAWPGEQEGTEKAAGQPLMDQMADGQTSEEASPFQTDERLSGETVQKGRAGAAEETDTQMTASFLNRMNEAIGQAAEMLETGTEVRQTADILNQVISQVRVGISQEITSMDFMLHPESLGRVNVSVAAKGGIMTAQITVQNQEAKEALESQMIVLKQTFEEQGLKVDSVEVNVSEFAFGGESQMGSSHAEDGGSGRRNGRNFRFEDPIGAEETDSGQEELAGQMMNMTGTQVDYSA